MDCLPAGEHGFQFVANTESSSLRTVKSGVLSVMICLEWISHKACGLHCSLEKLPVLVPPVASETPGSWSFLTNFAGGPSASHGSGRTVSTPVCSRVTLWLALPRAFAEKGSMNILVVFKTDLGLAWTDHYSPQCA